MLAGRVRVESERAIDPDRDRERDDRPRAFERVEFE